MRQMGEEVDEESAMLQDSYLAQMRGHELLIDMEMVVRKSTHNETNR